MRSIASIEAQYTGTEIQTHRDNAVKKDHPEISHIYCDRKNPEGVRKTLLQLNQQLQITSENKWHAVVDFSAYYDTYIEPTTVLAGLIGKYVLISTDSCYNNSLERVQAPIKEDSFDIVEELRLIELKDKINDSYGYNKLKCEVFLNKSQPYDFICLRLPDVLGEYDQFESSQRVWCTVNWVINSQKYPILLNKKMQEKRLSFVDSVDVAKAVLHFIESDKPQHNAYNLACDEAPTLKDFYELIAQALNKPAKFQQSQREDLIHFFPSVESGVIDCHRAKKEIGWVPTPLKKTVQRFVEFYTTKALMYPKEKEMMQAQFSSFLSKIGQ